MIQASKARPHPQGSWILALGDPCEDADLPEEVRGRVRAQQVLAIARMTPVLMVANVVNACAVVLALHLSGQFSLPAGLWALLTIALALRTLWVARRSRPTPFPATMRQGTCDKVVRNAALYGLLWAIPGVHFLPMADGTAQALIAAVLTGMIGGGALALHPIPAAAIVFLISVAAGGLLGMARTGDPMLIGFILIALAFFLVVWRNILRHSEVFVSEFVGKLELEEKNRLVAQLLDETRSAASEEKLRSERRLAQAQKMEAIGQLTGGVAHDFNNLLAAIRGNAELIALDGKADPALVTPIIGATERGSDLVRRLLSVARRQALKPEAIDVGKLIAGMMPLLRRTLGAEIEIETEVDGSTWNASADPGALESAILNLVLNARDAMPRGGRLAIECGNAHASANAALRRLGVRWGEFVQVVVRDTGRGMTPEVRGRALEPFFSTKGNGGGTGLGSGLGLSTAFGFVRQSGGHLAIESEVGTGTVVRLFLPRCAAAPAVPTIQVPEAHAVMGGGETILVVEDDGDLCALVAGMLKTLNYRVESARDAAEALRVLGAGGAVDLVLADIELPGGMSGVDLAAKISTEHGGLPVVLMSGHPEGDPAAGTPGTAGTPGAAHEPLLAKPFGRRRLAERIGVALAARQRAQSRAPVSRAAREPGLNTSRGRPRGRRRRPS